MPKTLIGYARCSTDKQDLTAQREALTGLGVTADRIYVDHGLTGTNRARLGLNQALAAVRKGDTLVVPKLDRLARSVPDARSIAAELAVRGVTLALGQSRYDPADPMGKMFFNILAAFAEFEADLIRLRTREGMKIARAKGRLRGKTAQAVRQAEERTGPHARHFYCDRSALIPYLMNSEVRANCTFDLSLCIRHRSTYGVRAGRFLKRDEVLFASIPTCLDSSLQDKDGSIQLQQERRACWFYWRMLRNRPGLLNSTSVAA